MIFATNNSHKLKEVKKILPSSIVISGLSEIGCTEELPETGATIKANAYQKARYIHDKFGVDCFADDTGLEVHALGGRPGVHSARYAGDKADVSKNIEKLLVELKGVEDRRANFRTVIALLINANEYYFEGIIEGVITNQTEGENGFGYDSVFIPSGYDITFAQMTPQQKNEISHRAIAINKLVEFLIVTSYH